MFTKNLPEEAVFTYARAKLAEPAEKICHECDRQLSVGEVLNNSCQRCGAKPSQNPNQEEPPF